MAIPKIDRVVCEAGRAVWEAVGGLADAAAAVDQ